MNVTIGFANVYILNLLLNLHARQNSDEVASRRLEKNRSNLSILRYRNLSPIRIGLYIQLYVTDRSSDDIQIYQIKQNSRLLRSIR
jgi:hypothetical protein